MFTFVKNDSSYNRPPQPPPAPNRQQRELLINGPHLLWRHWNYQSRKHVGLYGVQQISQSFQLITVLSRLVWVTISHLLCVNPTSGEGFHMSSEVIEVITLLEKAPFVFKDPNMPSHPKIIMTELPCWKKHLLFLKIPICLPVQRL